MATGLNIVVPVYNGAGVLAETIGSLTVQGGPFLNVTVVVNGCTDASEEVARASLEELLRSGAEARVVCSEKPSRAAALNAGDAFARVGWRHLYLDQDVRLSPNGVRRIMEALDGGWHFVGATARWRSPSKTVLAAMEAWNRLPYVVGAPATAGMYAVSATGRRRWAAWPKDVPDDKFARLNFHPDERIRLDDVEYSVEAPSSFAGLVAARRRYAGYNRDLRERMPQLLRLDRGRGLGNAAAVRSGAFRGLSILLAAETLARLRATR